MGSSTHAANNGNNKNRSDLTTIRGIGASRKQWLNELGIYTIADLSQISVDEIEPQLKCNGRLLSRNELEEWIAQAKTTDSKHQQTEEPYKLEHPLPASDITTSTDWHSIALFKLEYQTRQTPETVEQRTVIHHLETDATESWPGFETQHIHSWTLDRLKTMVPPPETEHPLNLDITQLRVIQPQHTEQSMIIDRSHPLFPAPIEINDPFTLEVSLNLLDSAVAKLAERQLSYRIQCFAHNVSTHIKSCLGDMVSDIAIADRSTYTARFPEITLHQPGIYRLTVWVTLQNRPASSSYFKVPMLQVV